MCDPLNHEVNDGMKNIKNIKNKTIVLFIKNILRNERIANYFKNIGEIEKELFINKALIIQGYQIIKRKDEKPLK